MDSRGVSPMIATIVLIAIVFAVAAILALSLASSPTPSPPFSGTLSLENVENGRNVIVIKHIYGDRAPDVVDNVGPIKWKNLELRVNGVIVPATQIIEIVAEGMRYTPPTSWPNKVCSMVVGDRIRIQLTTALTIGDEVVLKWVPKNQAIVEAKVTY